RDPRVERRTDSARHARAASRSGPHGQPQRLTRLPTPHALLPPLWFSRPHRMDVLVPLPAAGDALSANGGTDGTRPLRPDDGDRARLHPLARAGARLGEEAVRSAPLRDPPLRL